MYCTVLHSTAQHYTVLYRPATGNALNQYALAPRLEPMGIGGMSSVSEAGACVLRHLMLLVSRQSSLIMALWTRTVPPGLPLAQQFPPTPQPTVHQW